MAFQYEGEFEGKKNYRGNKEFSLSAGDKIAIHINGAEDADLVHTLSEAQANALVVININEE